MGTYFVANINMVTIECYKCHILFAVPQEFKEKQLELRESGGFHCPNGHSQVFIGKSAKDKQISNLRKTCSSLQECCTDYKEQSQMKTYQIGAYKGQLTKLKKAS
jgi:hypothetical protein